MNLYILPIIQAATLKVRLLTPLLGENKVNSDVKVKITEMDSEIIG